MDAFSTDVHSLPGHLIRRLHQIAVSQFVARMEDAGVALTPVQFAALSAVAAHPGIDQASAAGLMAYDRATLGKAADRLAEKGLIGREVSDTDRRARVLMPTPEGHTVLARAQPAVRAAQACILAGLDDTEQRQFLALLRKLTEAGNGLSRAPQRALRDRL